MTIQTAVLIETLVELGADVRWCELQHLLDTGPRRSGDRRKPASPVFAMEGRNRWRNTGECTAMALSFPERQDGGFSEPDRRRRRRRDACCIHKGYKAENDASTLDREPLASQEDAGHYRTRCARLLTEDPDKWHRTRDRTGAASRRRPPPAYTGFTRCRRAANCCSRHQCERLGDQKSKFDNLYGCRESLADGIKRATDVMIAGKVVVVCGYGDVGKGCAQEHALVRRPGDRHRNRPDLRAAGRDGRFRGEDGRGRARRKATSTSRRTGNCDIIRIEHMERMRDQAIVCNIGHFDDEIQMAGLEAYPGIVKTEIKPQVDKYTFPRRPLDLRAGRGPSGEPGLCDGTSVVRDEQLVHATRLSRRSSCGPGRWTSTVYRLPKHLDEEVARLHLDISGRATDDA